MALNWLFGPPTEEGPAGVLYVRCLVIDHDTVRDALTLVRELTGEAGAYTIAPETGEPQPFDMTRLQNAPDWELRRLMVRGGVGHSSFAVDLRAGHRPSVIYSGHPPEAGRAVANQLLAEGRPRPLWLPMVPRLPVLLAACMLVAWIWYLATSTPPLSLGLAASLGFCLLTVVAWDLVGRIQERIGTGYPGIRIRTMSRQEVRGRRADRHANLRVASITIPAGALLGALATWLIRR